jgi:hypothetical protein
MRLPQSYLEALARDVMAERKRARDYRSARDPQRARAHARIARSHERTIASCACELIHELEWNAHRAMREAERAARCKVCDEPNCIDCGGCACQCNGLWPCGDRPLMPAWAGDD